MVLISELLICYSDIIRWVKIIFPDRTFNPIIPNTEFLNWSLYNHFVIFCPDLIVDASTLHRTNVIYLFSYV